MSDQVTRGFEKLIGETIVSVDQTSINVIHITTASGKNISIDAEDHHFGIPVLRPDRDWSVSK